MHDLQMFTHYLQIVIVIFLSGDVWQSRQERIEKNSKMAAPLFNKDKRPLSMSNGFLEF